MPCWRRQRIGDARGAGWSKLLVSTPATFPSAAMPTAAERQALAFLAVIAALGAGGRVLAARGFERELASAGPRPEADGVGGVDDALDRQIRAVDSARDARSATARRSPAPRTAASGSPRPSARSAAAAARTSVAMSPIDVDVASAAELERLPRIGPALAARIVATRDSLGGFGSMEALRHVRGIGPSTAALLEPLVTFSSRPRPFHDAAPGTRRRPVVPAH
jgi:DNA uptake protein ComE-like DNA-binding protein